MYETLIRPHQVDVVPAPMSVHKVAEQLKRGEVKREEKRLRQIAQAHRNPSKRKRDDTEGYTAEAKEHDGEDAAQAKRAKTEETEDVPVQIVSAVTTPTAGTPAPISAATDVDARAEPAKISVSKAFPEVRGHTSYLTFAVLLPASVAGKEVDLAPHPTEILSGEASGSVTPQSLT
jgi:tRNA (adenine57-N1/adenine58-N1)-methyltransferase catalytic subunit